MPPFATTQLNSDGAIEPQRVRITRSPDCTPPRCEICYPSLRVVTQGAARMTFGDVELSGSNMQAFLVDEEMPARSEIAEASIDKPFCCISIDLDRSLLRSLMRELGPFVWDDTRVGARVVNLQAPAADCVLRLFQLVESPTASCRIAAPHLQELHHHPVEGVWRSRQCDE